LVNSILDDVKVLLMKRAGDPKILEQVKRAAENDEVISIYEREYVAHLAKQYLDPMRSDRSVQPPRQERPADPPKKVYRQPEDRYDPKNRYDPQNRYDPKNRYDPQNRYDPKNRYDPRGRYRQEPAVTEASGGSQQKMSAPRPARNAKTMIILGAAAAAVVLGVALVVGLGLIGTTPEPGTKPPPIEPPTAPEYAVGTSQLSYNLGDIVDVSGTADPSLGSVDLLIADPSGNTIWKETATVMGDGSFSMLLFAGGSGWDATGEYDLLMRQGDTEISSTFIFVL
jgi:hypothetical protein